MKKKGKPEEPKIEKTLAKRPKTPTEKAELMTVPEVAKLCGKSAQSVYKMCSNGILRSKRFGERTVLVYADSVEVAKNLKRGRRPGPGKETATTRIINRLRASGNNILADEIERTLGGKGTPDPPRPQAH